MSENDRYLWDKTGEPDPEVERLEQWLAPLAHRGGEASPAVATRRPWIRYAAAAAVLAAIGVGAYVATRPSPDAPPPGPSPREQATKPVSETPPEVPAQPDFRLSFTSGDEKVPAGSWIHATDVPREVTLGDLVRLRLDPGSRLRVDRAGEGGALLFLERGALEARVSSDARPRFFQVDTYAARCVDLGCRYTLAVEDGGVARVRVTTGQVSFENGTREVFVPAHAGCVAKPGSGPGTPRFDDVSEELSKALDAFDAPGTAPDRRAQADRVLAAVRTTRDTLSAWHLLQDADEVVALAARKTLEAQVGHPKEIAPQEGRPDAAEREAWKDYLLDRFWR